MYYCYYLFTKLAKANRVRIVEIISRDKVHCETIQLLSMIVHCKFTINYHVKTWYLYLFVGRVKNESETMKYHTQES